ncbi:unnamed protein product [Protopolystoma xenopodis]|uniref:Uncharacterized protein n=1 Tax=Protopolystoma xenopodis TaxID=117903 RepID=A0A3S5A4Y9_9PLAT|nr:unnamed protein product [Protopolystoma xenopodis]
MLRRMLPKARRIHPTLGTVMGAVGLIPSQRRVERRERVRLRHVNFDSNRSPTLGATASSTSEGPEDGQPTIGEARINQDTLGSNEVIGRQPANAGESHIYCPFAEIYWHSGQIPKKN